VRCKYIRRLVTVGVEGGGGGWGTECLREEEGVRQETLRARGSDRVRPPAAIEGCRGWVEGDSSGPSF